MTKEWETKNAHALNNPRVGDMWSEMMANRTYVCDIDKDTTAVKAVLVTGAGQEAWFFATVGDFQDWLMYDTGPVGKDCLSGWTWCDFVKNVDDHDTWAQEWEEAAVNGLKVRGEITFGEADNAVKESVESQEMKF